MGSFILRRIGLGLIAVLGVSVLVFLNLHMIPGDPVDHLAGGEATKDQRDKIADCMGLQQGYLVARDADHDGDDDRVRTSLPAQFVRFLGDVADGSLGHQCPNTRGRPTVMARILEVLPNTLWLAITGMLIGILLALPIGIVAAVRQGTWIDTAATVFSLSGMSMPVMLMGPLLLLWFFVDLGWFPGPTETGPASLVLPAFAIGTHLMAMLARMTRSSMVEVLGEDYVRTARAKGLPTRVVLAKHALRNALLPVITVAGLQFGSMLSGAIITEKVFARPGIGLLLLDAIAERNYPVVQGCVLVIAVFYVSVNLLVDLAYGLVDPRIRRA
ncbi:MAG: ABC transporter permease [Kofleriaceae bacterium]|nr:ABC transporter permease [Kofleriaceae bacterium]